MQQKAAQQKELQQIFSRSILMQDDTFLPYIEASTKAEKQARFAVYRNNVYHSLIEALETIYPVCRMIVGDDYFRMLAGHFIQHHPPVSPILSEYGEAFADFVRPIPQLSALPYFSELARLEYQLLQLTHAAEHPALSAADIQQRLSQFADPTQTCWQLAEPCLLWHTTYAIGSIYTAHQPDSGIALENIQWEKREFLLLSKNEHYGHCYLLTEAEYHLLDRLRKGNSLERAGVGVKPSQFIPLFSTLMQKPVFRDILPFSG